MSKRKVESKTCTWKQMGAGSFYWSSSCGYAIPVLQHIFKDTIIQSTPESLGWAFCPYCGRPLKEVTDDKTPA